MLLVTLGIELALNIVKINNSNKGDNMKPTEANIINFYELSEAWQAEAVSNLDEYAEENHYLEPTCEYDTNIVLWDLNECIAQSGSHNGFEYNCVIGISNNTAMLLNVDDNFETCEYIIV